MDQSLHDHLLEGEVVRWTGRPAPFKISQLTFSSSLYIIWLCCAGAAVAALFLILPILLGKESNMADVLIVLVILLAIPGLLSLMPLFDKFKVENSSIYAITNLRAISIVDNKVLSLPLTDETAASIRSQCGEMGILCIGSSAQTISDYRTMACAVTGVSQGDLNNNVDGLVFFNVLHPDQVMDHLKL